ncbi:MAG: outer membrane lipoprotein-sorting protein [Alphaproteobacteria bacterium]
MWSNENHATSIPVTHGSSPEIDQKDYQVRKVEFFDRRYDLLKTLAQKERKQYDGKYWRSRLLSMTNHQTRKSTDLRFSDYAFKTGQRDHDFSKSILKRLR